MSDTPIAMPIPITISDKEKKPEGQEITILKMLLSWLLVHLV